MSAGPGVYATDKALDHTTRRAVVAALARQGGELSPTGFARLEGVERTRALYHHFGVLVRHDLMELVRTEERSTVERFYSLTASGRVVARPVRSGSG
jgi:hypothetical protein